MNVAAIIVRGMVLMEAIVMVMVNGVRGSGDKKMIMIILIVIVIRLMLKTVIQDK